MRLAHYALAALVMVCSACGVELEHALDERQANQIVAVLDDHGVAAEKARDDGVDAWKIIVARNDLPRSVQILDGYDLPRRGRRGMAETLAERGLVPTMGEERARLEAARAAELERTLERVPGVVAARVHLALPDEGRLDLPAATPTASVLIRAEGAPGAAPPIDEARVRALVAGATIGLRPEAISVVFATARAATPANPTEPVGPLRVARGERSRVVAIAASGLTLLVLLGAALLVAALRLSRARRRQ